MGELRAAAEKKKQAADKGAEALQSAVDESKAKSTEEKELLVQADAEVGLRTKLNQEAQEAEQQASKQKAEADSASFDAKKALVQANGDVDQTRQTYVHEDKAEQKTRSKFEAGEAAVLAA